MTQDLDQDETIPSPKKSQELEAQTDATGKISPDQVVETTQTEPSAHEISEHGITKTENNSETIEITTTPVAESGEMEQFIVSFPDHTPANSNDGQEPLEKIKIPTLSSGAEEELSHHTILGTDDLAESHEETEELHEEVEATENYHACTKEELIRILEDFLKEQDIGPVRPKVAALKEAFNDLIAQEKNLAIASEHVAEEDKLEQEKQVDPLSDKFFALLKKFNRRRIELREKLEQEKNENLKAKSEILQQLKNLIQYEENMQKAFNMFHELQAKWRAIGPTPQQNVNDLWLTYKLYVDKFYELIRINKELQDLDFRKNLAAKIKICERAEELILEPSINKALNHLQSLQNQFRETGPVPRESKNEVWDRFKAASDKIFERKKEYLDAQKEKYSGSLAEKTALCEKAEELARGVYQKSSEWQEKIKEFLQLQAEWKKTGFSGKVDNDKIWQRFKSAFDLFFQNKKDFYNQSKEEHNSNLQKKTELCLHAEALKESTDWKNTSNELKRLQQEWKTIGHAGEYQERKIFNRFRKACDTFFENKSKHFASQDQEQEENYQKKIQLIEQIESYETGSNQFENIEALKKFQRQWMECGLVPISKKEEINSRYKKAIDGQFGNLKIDDSDRNKLNYSRKIESYKSKPGAGRDKMDDEKRFLINKINSLKNDVSLWENNIGFFAKSKNADVLKKEFEEKINKAKEEIKTLHEKMEQIKKA